MGLDSKKFHKNFCKNFFKTSPKTWITQCIFANKNYNSKDPVAITKATWVPIIVLIKKMQVNQENESSLTQIQVDIDMG